MPPSDATAATPEQLARRAQAGCSQSFADLVRHYQVPLLHFLRRHTRHATDAEDLLQDTFLRCHQALDRYDPSRRFGTWLFTIAYRLVVDHRRSQTVRQRPPGPAGSPSETPDGIASQREEALRLWDLARGHLPPEQFTSLWLHYAHDLPVREIATVMRRTQPGVKILMFRGRRTLRTVLQARGLAHELDPHDRGSVT